MAATEVNHVGAARPRRSSAGGPRRSSRPATTPSPRSSSPTQPDVDLHRAIELLENGCPPELAVQILT